MKSGFIKGASTEVSSYGEEEARIRAAYAHRDESGKRELYSWWQPDVLLSYYRIQAVTSAYLRRAGWNELSRLRALDVGCGSGAWLRQLLAWGGRAENLHGVDLLADRIATARRLTPDADYRQADGWQLPYANASMDLVSAHTVFSSILNEHARAGVAIEMTRVLDPHGCILIFDFRISHPMNPDTVGIRRREIRRLFPGFRQYAQSLILAPPIARRLAPFAPWLAVVLEALCPPLRTHNVFLLQRKEDIPA
jgi:ubiquinone/menaquinone biosynthesis C-methylase UbiE